ncbi:MAG TPA: class E sortase [Jatrophihabitantaceae bacterium]|jgi:sortase A
MTIDDQEPPDDQEDGAVRTGGRHARPDSAMSRADKVRLGLRGTGQTLITLGVVVLLFVVYELWVTNIFAQEKQHKVHSALEKEWANGDDPLVVGGSLNLPGSKQGTIPTGTGIANIYIPRLGTDYHFTIVEGTNDADLEKGPGHYVHTALPGQVGNFAVAGHRVGKGEPFLNLDHLRPGDAIVIETKNTWYVYTVKGNVQTGDLNDTGTDGIPGREIVSPSDTDVISAVADHPGQTPTEKMITLTTCHPKFTATQRMILHGTLSRQVARNGSALPKELAGGTI